MAFDVMPKESIKKVVEWCFETQNNILILTLLDGSSVCGMISGHYSYYCGNRHGRAKAKDCCFTENEVILKDRRQYNEKDYFIPFKKIAGIASFSYTQEEFYVDFSYPLTKKERGINVIPYDRNLPIEEQIKQDKKLWEHEKKLVTQGKYSTKTGFEDALLDDLHIKCQQEKFQITTYYCDYMSIAFPPFAWGELRAKVEYPVYTDWDYIQTISGGINSIGAGIMAVSGSLAWQKSLYYIRERLMKKKSREISTIEKEEVGSVVIYAYIDHIHIKKGRKKKVPYEMIEGDNWFPVILSKEPIFDLDDMKNDDWCVGYMREKCIMVPKIALESTQAPLKIQGEIVPIPVKTPYGNSDFFIKVRNISSISSSAAEKKKTNTKRFTK